MAHALNERLTAQRVSRRVLAVALLSCVVNLGYLWISAIFVDGARTDPDTGFGYGFLLTAVVGAAALLLSKWRWVGVGLLLGEGLAFILFVVFVFMVVLPQTY
ncbi:MAG TPA: hypothetical protein VFG72_12350 [Marmoricola sp.]|nr:hypothetical protein [Marmoricola sp.]